MRKDVPPFILAVDDPLRYGGLNRVGLSRRGFSESTLDALKKAYKILYRSKLLLADALQQVEDEFGHLQEINELTTFFRKSERGVIR